MLQQRRDRHDEKTAGETEQREADKRCVYRQIRRGQQHTDQRHPERAERHEAIFDFATGKITGRRAAEADAERERSVQITDLCFREVKSISAVEKQIQQQQRAEKIKIGVAEESERERTVFAHGAQLREQIAQKIHAKFSGRVGGGHARDAEARRQSGERQRDKNGAGPDLTAAKALGQETGGHGAEDDGHERAEFEQTVAPREFFLRQQLRQQAVFGGAEERAVDAHQKNAAQQHRKLVQPEAREREEHHGDFKNLHADGNRAFAEAVGQKSARHGKQDERQRKQRADKFADFMLFRQRHVHADEHEDDEIFEDVVAEGALELCDDERPETAEPARGCPDGFRLAWRIHASYSGPIYQAPGQTGKSKNFRNHRFKRWAKDWEKAVVCHDLWHKR